MFLIHVAQVMLLFSAESNQIISCFSISGLFLADLTCFCYVQNINLLPALIRYLFYALGMHNRICNRIICNRINLDITYREDEVLFGTWH